MVKKMGLVVLWIKLVMLFFFKHLHLLYKDRNMPASQGERLEEYLPPLDPKTMKHEDFLIPRNMGYNP